MRKAFTLVELMVVLVIVGTLAIMAHSKYQEYLESRNNGVVTRQDLLEQENEALRRKVQLLEQTKGR